MENIKHWRVGVITAIIYSGSEIALYSQKETKVISKASNQGFGNITKVNMVGEVNVKINFLNEDPMYHSDPNWEKLTGIEILIKSAEFPDPNNWYHLRNFYSRHLGTILRQCKFDVETGEFNDVFSPIVSSSSDMTEFASLASESMKEYDEYLEETVREMNCEINKKTKKWVPGHRYDSPAETRYPLCKIKIRKNNTEDYAEHPEVDAWIYTNQIGESKTIGEVLRSRSFGEKPEDLKIMTTIPGGYVESGEVLGDDLSGDINEYMKAILENSKDKFFSNLYEESQNFYYYITPYLILDSKEDWAKAYLLDAINEFGRQCLYTLWNRKELMVWYGLTGNRKIGDEKSLNDNKEALQDLLFYRIPDKNLDKVVYYTRFFQTYGLKMDEVCENLLKSWNPNKFTASLDEYMKNLKYIQVRKPASLTRLDARKDSLVINKSDQEIHKLKDLVGEGVLYDTIREMLFTGSYSQKRSLGGSKDYVFEEADITLQELLDYAKQTNGEIPEDLKNEILLHQFINIHLMYDADKTIE